MRVTGGTFRGQRLVPFTDARIRPTTDHTRRAIFDVIVHRFPDVVTFKEGFVIDVFSGTGILGIEALSRGAKHVTFIDKSKIAQAIIRANIQEFGLENKSTILILDLEITQYLPSIHPCILAFFDPPYIVNKSIVTSTLRTVKRNQWLREGALCIVQHYAGYLFDIPTCFHFVERRTYGKTSVSFLLFHSSIL